MTKEKQENNKDCRFNAAHFNPVSFSIDSVLWLFVIKK